MYRFCGASGAVVGFRAEALGQLVTDRGSPGTGGPPVLAGGDGEG